MRCANCGNEALPGRQFCARHQGLEGGTAPTADVYATFWHRAGAAIVDYIIVSVVFLILGAVTRTGAGAGSQLLLPVLVAVLYYVIFESSTLQGTPGKLALGIKVTDERGERIGFGRALGRYLGKFVSNLTLFIGYLMPLFTSRREALHDKIAGTLVVNKQVAPEEVATAGPAPRTSGAAVAVVVVVLVFGLTVVMGILAAISIPAYQDYTVRSQVIEGISAASPYKTAVAEAFASGKPFSEISSESLQLEPPAGLNYVESVEVANGSIAITYGGKANSRISGKVLALVPTTTGESSDIVWICGRHGAPAGATPAIESPAQYTSLEDKFLPSSCRRGT
jgi:uncharacterized RDD family membrane protein YckC